MGDENCRECLPSVEVRNVKKDIVELKEQMTRATGDISKLRTTTSVSTQEIKQVFNILNEIKSSLKEIADTLRQTPSIEEFRELKKQVEELKMLPARRWDESTKLVATVVITALATFVMSKILK